MHKKIKIEYLDSDDVFAKYPSLTKNFNWRKSDLMRLLNNKLLAGYYDSGQRNCMIEEESLRALIQHANRLLEKQVKTIKQNMQSIESELETKRQNQI